jgi:hypothetical protein
MPVILRNNENSVEIDIHANLKYSVNKGGFDVVYEDTGTEGTPMVIIILHSSSLIKKEVRLDWRDTTSPDAVFDSAESLRDTLLAWNKQVVSVTSIDNTSLYGGVISVEGAGVSIDTSGYGAVVAQFSGVWSGVVFFEISNDNITWQRSTFYSSEEVVLRDKANCNGFYIIPVIAKYLRYSIGNIEGFLTLSILGKTSYISKGADAFSLAMDKAEQVPLQVQLPKDIKQDSQGGVFLSDMSDKIEWICKDDKSPLIIDCAGYQSVIVQKTTAGAVVPSVSNDKINFVTTLVLPISSGAQFAATIATAAGIYVLPVVAKWLKLVGPASAIQCIIYLSSTPINVNAGVANPPVNLQQVGGATLVPSGSVSTGYPLQVGGVDDSKSPLVKRFLVDALGRLMIGTNTRQNPGLSNSPEMNVIGYLANYRNILEVQDTTRGEDGVSVIDLLSQLLFEMKIMNQQLYELPRLIDQGLSSPDSPEDFRKRDNKIFE